MERSAREIVRASVYVAATTVALGLFELLPVAKQLSVRGLLGLSSLAAALGGILGLVLAGYLYVTARLRWPARVALDVALATAVGAWQFRGLGILAKWQGATLRLARLSAGGVVGFAVVLVVTAMLARLVAAGRGGRWLQALAALGGVVAAAGLVYVSRSYNLTEYPSLELLLRVGAFAYLGLAAVMALSRLSLPWLRARYWLSALLVLAFSGDFALASHGDLHLLLANETSRPLVTGARRLSDWDQDGYSSWFGGQDCAPFDATVHVLARDLPGDGIDQDCRGGDAQVQAAPKPTAQRTSAGPRPSIVLISVDSLAAARMSVYGAKRDTTPNLAAWASANAVRFERAYTSGGWTSLALPTMLRGLYPRRLSWTRIYETNRLRLLRAPIKLPPLGRELVARGFALPIDDTHPTVNQLLGQAGYATAAVIDDGATAYFRKELGGFKGFDFYENSDRGGDAGTTNSGLRYLSGVAPDKPFFLWMHYFGVHGPSTRHAGAPFFGWRTVTERYDHEIAYFDQELARLLARIDEMRKSRDVVVIITADHGEEITSVTRFHGHSLNESAIHIPLLVSRGPGASGVRSDVVSLVDVAPSLLAAAHLPAPVLDGVDLFAPPKPRAVRFETFRLDRYGQLTLDLVGMSDGRTKVTLDTRLLDEAAFDVSAGGKAHNVPFSRRHEELLERLYRTLGEDGPLRFAD